MDKLKIALCIGILIAIGSCTCSLVRADDCQNPEKLSPEIKKSREQLIEMCKELGCTVSIRCWEKVEVKK